MKITVVHKAFEDTPIIVAEVTAPADAESVESALEYAYRWTNNVMAVSYTHLKLPTILRV